MSLAPVSLKGDAAALRITWNDGVEHVISWKQLRDGCPCAGCRVERAQPPPLFPILKPEDTIPLKAQAMHPVGNYAYQIEFTDGHHSGIYSFDLLRQLGSEAAEAS